MKKLLFAIGILLLAGTVEAGEPDWSMKMPKTLDNAPPTCRTWWKSSGSGKPTSEIICDGDRVDMTPGRLFTIADEPVEYPVKKGDPVIHYSLDCYRKMQAAMRAMDSFVPRVYDKESSVIEGWMKGERTSQEITAARKQWDATMKECVK